MERSNTGVMTSTAPPGHSRVRSLPGWSYRFRDAFPGTKLHGRALSSTAILTDPTDLRSRSVPSFPEMTAVVAPAPVSASALQLSHDHHIINYEPDFPRPGAAADNPRNPDPSLLHSSDVGTEVTALSNKLIAAINSQTTLDDSLAAARLELERSKEEVQRLEAEKKEHDEMLVDGTLVKRAEIESENAELREAAEMERQQRVTAEDERKSIERELENLTTALFEEANQVWQDINLFRLDYQANISSDGGCRAT